MTFKIENNSLANLIIYLPIILVIILGIILKILKRLEIRSLTKDLAENFDKIDTTHNYKIYEKGRIIALKSAAVIIFAAIALTFLFKNTHGILLLVAILPLVILGASRHIPNFVFKCPKCGTRKIKHKQELISIGTTYSKGKKTVYFKCNNCGFQTMENVVLPTKY
ncbi:MAG: hypothetical protein ACM3UU_07005 [Ignavibacteriales bacterium]